MPGSHAICHPLRDKGDDRASVIKGRSDERDTVLVMVIKPLAYCRPGAKSRQSPRGSRAHPWPWP